MPKLYLLIFLSLLVDFVNAQTTISVVADKDNTIFSVATSNSAGAEQYFYAGRNADNNQGSVQRALLHFNLSGIPSGAVITAASLTVTVNKTAAVATGIELHKITADWGEGTSDASSSEGAGSPATTNDATWNQRMFPSTAWTTAGGDFDASISASIPTVGSGIRTSTALVLSGAGAINDVQNWITSPAANFGWIILAYNETPPGSAKRFVSRNSTIANQRPTLTVTYSIALPITLKSFSASLVKQNALLNWITATEIDNDHFDIEHSLNGKDFASIGQVKGNGSSTTEHAYTYVQENLPAGKHFYRIVDVGRSGNKGYSQIVVLSLGSLSALQLYPNPATSIITINASASTEGNEYAITTAGGQTVLKGVVRRQQINVQKLSTGQYYLVIKTKDGEILRSLFLKN